MVLFFGKLFLGQQQAYIFKKNHMRERCAVFYNNKIFDFDGEKFNNMREAQKHIIKNFLLQPSKQTRELTQTKCMTGVGLIETSYFSMPCHIISRVPVPNFEGTRVPGAKYQISHHPCW